MNTPVSFNTAKLLKEKGFDEQILSIYQDGEIMWLKSTISNKQFTTSRNYSAPTIAEVVMWLYEKHNIWITVTISSFYDENNIRTLNWDYTIYSPKDDVFISCEDDTEFKSPTEAYEAAIEYTLKNLI